MAILESGQRAELGKALQHDAYEFMFEELKRPEYSNPLYRQFFQVIEPPTGDEGIVNSANMNVSYKETAYGESVEKSSATEARRHPYKLKRFSAAQAFDRDMIEKDSSKDAVKMMLQNWVQAAVKKMMTKKEQEFHKAFNQGAKTAGHGFFNQSGRQFADDDLLYDGLPLLNLTGNPRTLIKSPDSGISNSFYNLLGASAVPLDSVNFNTAWTLMNGTNIYGDDGAPDPFVPDLLICHPSKWLEAMQITETQSGLPNETNNGMNPWRGVIQAVSSPFITETDAWFLFSRTNLWQAIEEPPRIDQWFDNKTKEYWVSLEFRFTARIMTWRNIVGANVSTS